MDKFYEVILMEKLGDQQGEVHEGPNNWKPMYSSIT